MTVIHRCFANCTQRTSASEGSAVPPNLRAPHSSPCALTATVSWPTLAAASSVVASTTMVPLSCRWIGGETTTRCSAINHSLDAVERVECHTQRQMMNTQRHCFLFACRMNHNVVSFDGNRRSFQSVLCCFNRDFQTKTIVTIIINMLTDDNARVQPQQLY